MKHTSAALTSNHAVEPVSYVPARNAGGPAVEGAEAATSAFEGGDSCAAITPVITNNNTAPKHAETFHGLGHSREITNIELTFQLERELNQSTATKNIRTRPTFPQAGFLQHKGHP